MARRKGSSDVTREFARRLSVPDLGRRYRAAEDDGKADAASRFDRIGAGAAAEVYLATDTELRRGVAMKVLRRQLNSDRATVTRFLYEARLTALLQHPNIVHVYDLGILPSNEVFFTMELVRGKTLRQLLDARRQAPRAVPRERLVRIFGQACEAVAYAHRHAVVHRDLKPENIMIGDANEVYVMDWGVARVLDDSPLHEALRAQQLPLPEEEDRARGTPQYMSPEQVLGMARNVDTRSDVFSLGIILYEILAGRHPFEADEVQALKHAIAHLPAPRLRPWRLPRGFAQICERALCKLPNDRYPSAVELVEDVNRAFEQRPLSVHRSSVWRWGLALVNRHRLATMLAVATVVLAGFSWREFSRGRRMQRQLLTSARDHVLASHLRENQLRPLREALQTAPPAARDALRNRIATGEARARAERQAALALLLTAAQRGNLPAPDREQLKRLLLRQAERQVAAGQVAAARDALVTIDKLRARGILHFADDEKQRLQQWHFALEDPTVDH